jgi:hypothetical protein
MPRTRPLCLAVLTPFALAALLLAGARGTYAAQRMVLGEYFNATW